MSEAYSIMGSNSRCDTDIDSMGRDDVGTTFAAKEQISFGDRELNESITRANMNQKMFDEEHKDIQVVQAKHPEDPGQAAAHYESKLLDFGGKKDDFTPCQYDTNILHSMASDDNKLNHMQYMSNPGSDSTVETKQNTLSDEASQEESVFGSKNFKFDQSDILETSTPEGALVESLIADDLNKFGSARAEDPKDRRGAKASEPGQSEQVGTVNNLADDFSKISTNNQKYNESTTQKSQVKEKSSDLAPQNDRKQLHSSKRPGKEQIPNKEKAKSATRPMTQMRTNPQYGNVSSRTGSTIMYKPSAGNMKVFSEKRIYDVPSKIGSLARANRTPGGGKVAIQIQKLDFKANAKPRIDSKSSHKRSQSAVKITSQRLDWKAQPKIGSLANINHKPTSGNVNITHTKLNWKAESKVDSLNKVKESNANASESSSYSTTPHSPQELDKSER